jgi:hypothetical protein
VQLPATRRIGLVIVLGGLASLLAPPRAHADDTVHVCLEVTNSASGIAVVTCPPVSATNPFPVVIEGGGSGVVGTTPVAFGVTVTASAVQMASHAMVFGPVCTAGISNASVVCLGGSGVNTTIGTGGTGYCLSAGQSISYGINNTNLLYAIGNNTTDTYSCTGN